MNGIGNGNSNACYSEAANCVSEKRPFVPINETYRRLDALADECIKISDSLAMALFSVEQTECDKLVGVCFADVLSGTADKVAHIQANLLVLADRFGIQV